MCLLYFVAYIDRVNISVAGPFTRKEFGLTPTELGLVFSAFAYPYAAMQIFGGWYADKFGPRLVLAVLSLIWAVATILCGFAWGLTSLVVFRFILGVRELGAFPTATRAFTFWLPATERGFAQGITHSFARLGGAVAPPVVIGIVAWYGWRESFIFLGAHAGTAGGMMNTGFGVAGMISPLAFGFLIQTTGSYQVPFLTSAGLLAVGIVGSLFIDPTRKVGDPPAGTERTRSDSALERPVTS